MLVRSKVCGAPGCGRPTAKAATGYTRNLNGMPVCRPCYQRAHEYAKRWKKNISKISVADLPPPKLDPPAPAAVCARKGCDVRFKAGERDSNRRRFIGGKTVCRACHLHAWEKAAEWNVSIEEALARLPAKGTYRRPRKFSAVKCAMPWCSAKVLDKTKYCVSEKLHAYACGQCQRYLHWVARRYRHTKKSWQEWGIEAIRGALASPNVPQECAMPWCNRMVQPASTRSVGRDTHGYGPEGQMICATDRMYLYLYARRKGVSRHRAFREAPPPRRQGFPRR